MNPEAQPRETTAREIGKPIEHIEQFLEQHISEVVAVIDSVRHGHTHYSEQYPDLTEEGEQAVAATADTIIADTQMLTAIARKADLNGFQQHVAFVSSPQPRARASAMIMKEKFTESVGSLGSPEALEGVSVVDFNLNNKVPDDPGKVRTVEALRATRIHNLPEAVQLLVELAEGDWSPRKADYMYTQHPHYDERPDMWELRSDVRKRSLGLLKRSVGMLRKYQAETGAVPRIIATSHFEVLNHVVMDAFQLSPEQEHDELLDRAEKFTMYIMKTEDPNYIPIAITFRDRSKLVRFNTQRRQFE